MDKPLYYSSLDKWVEGWLALVYRRNVGGKRPQRWDPSWWMNAEAIFKLEAMWRTWESCRHDPARGMADWIRSYGDPIFNQLTHADGPFAKSAATADAHEPLPCNPAPNGFFTWQPSITEPIDPAES